MKDLVSYQQLVVELLFTSESITAGAWSSPALRFWNLASILAQASHEQPESVQDYLAWVPESSEVVQEGAAQLAVNTFRSTHDMGIVDIKLGSIHSAKGQSHTATLVLETYNHGPFIDSLLPRASGLKSHDSIKPGKRITQRLLAMCVAMISPTHLLCLAISRRTLGEGEAFDANCARLRKQGWDIQLL